MENSKNTRGESPFFNINIMCIYETKLINMKYQPTIKNGGRVPKIKDYRQMYIKIGCGWCIECRKKISNDWRIRLTEEIKSNKSSEFITFSFSPESIRTLKDEIITKKYKGIDGKEIDVNILAAYSLRMFSERWRKKYKKSPRYWFVTELGHTNSERLHLHGIIFNTTNKTRKKFQKDIIEKWKYGNVYIGQWVDIRTINYLMKYVTKLDDKHTGYKQKIFTSKKMGENYIYEKKNLHKFNGEKTITKYKNSNGTLNALPRYYKEKLWTEEEREKLWTYQLDENKIYIGGEIIEKKENEADEDNFERKLEKIREINEKIGYGNRKTINKKYIITEKMMLNYEDLKKYKDDNLVKSVERRTKKEYNYEKKEKYSKEIDGIIELPKYYIGTTTEAERNRNAEIEEAENLGISVRELRLKKAGILK